MPTYQPPNYSCSPRVVGFTADQRDRKRAESRRPCAPTPLIISPCWANPSTFCNSPFPTGDSNVRAADTLCSDCRHTVVPNAAYRSTCAKSLSRGRGYGRRDLMEPSGRCRITGLTVRSAVHRSPALDPIVATSARHDSIFTRLCRRVNGLRSPPPPRSRSH